MDGYKKVKNLITSLRCVLTVVGLYIKQMLYHSVTFLWCPVLGMGADGVNSSRCD
jgi:hypothetical protein